MENLTIKEIETNRIARNEVLELLSLARAIYLDRFCNYLTTDLFCEHNLITKEIYQHIAALGKLVENKENFNQL